MGSLERAFVYAQTKRKYMSRKISPLVRKKRFRDAVYVFIRSTDELQWPFSEVSRVVAGIKFSPKTGDYDIVSYSEGYRKIAKRGDFRFLFRVNTIDSVIHDRIDEMLEMWLVSEHSTDASSTVCHVSIRCDGEKAVLETSFTKEPFTDTGDEAPVDRPIVFSGHKELETHLFYALPFVKYIESVFAKHLPRPRAKTRKKSPWKDRSFRLMA